jgi:soluble lytic murein transglycosylase
VKRTLIILAAIVAVVGTGFAVVQHQQPGWWVRLWYPLSYQQEIVGYAHQNHIDPALVAAVIYKESHFNSSARSHAGAIGLMQLLPSTAKGIAIHTGGGNFHPETDLLNPDLNIRYGCWYLRHLMGLYSRYPNNRNLALAAYNAGEANVDSWIASVSPGQPVPIRFAETRDYISSVRHLQTLYRRGYGDQLTTP